MKTVWVKILGYKRSQRYAVWRALVGAQRVFESDHPDYCLDIQQLTSSEEILRYTPVIAFPSLVMGDQLVCVGRFPAKEEILAWLQNEICSHNELGIQNIAQDAS